MAEFADWERNFVMVGNSPVGWKAVLFTGDGTMYTLLQGETVAEELRTVRLDNEGRISAFIIDSTDAWGRMLSIGNAELAARLGSPVAYERTGEVQFIETFEQGMQLWTYGLDGDGASVALSPVSSLTGGYSLKLTGGDDDLRYAIISFRRGSLPLGRLGLAVGFALPGTIDHLDVKMSAYDGTHMHVAAVNYVDTANELEYLDFEGNYQWLADVGITQRNAAIYNRIKFVVDFENELYVKCLLNQVSYDMATIPIYSREVGDYRHMHCGVSLYSREDSNDVAYIDDIVFTVAEP